jgi:cyanamide hydratase
MCQDETASNGWTTTPANAGTIFGDRLSAAEPLPLLISELEFPSKDPVVAKTVEYAKGILHPETFNHSMRVYYYGV